MKPSLIFYNKIRDELATLGIFIEKKDVFVLAKIVLGCLFDTVEETTSTVSIGDSKAIVASSYRGGIKVFFNKNYKNSRKFICMTDNTNRLIFERMFSKVLDDLDYSMED